MRAGMETGMMGAGKERHELEPKKRPAETEAGKTGVPEQRPVEREAERGETEMGQPGVGP